MLRKIILTILLVNFTAVLSGANALPEKILSPALLESARQGNAQAQLQVGFVYFKQNNPVRAAYWFNAAARQELPEAQYNLGYCYLAGYGLSANKHAAMEWFQKAADHGLPAAQLALAKLCLSGIAAAEDAVPPRPAILADEKKAYALLEKLIAQNMPEARIIYAGHLIAHHHRATAPERILQLLTPGAEANHPGAMIMLADYLLSRKDAYRDEVRARSLLEKAAPHSAEAMAKLAFAVENGFGAPPDPPGAFRLYTQALELGFSPQAAVRLGNYYLAGRHGARQDIPKAIQLYTQAAEAGIPEAIALLGNCYQNGIGVEQDPVKAFELYFQAAKLDHPPAQYAVGYCFAGGIGTPQDEQAAFFWFRQAAMRYEPRSLLETGKRLLEGRGTGQDPAQAVIFLEQALANGMNEAAVYLEKARRMPQLPMPEARELPKFKLRNPPQL